MINPAFFHVFGSAALVHPAHVGALLAAVASPGADTTMRGVRDPNAYAGYKVDNGAAIIPVRGTLITDGAFVGERWGVTSYEGLRAELGRAIADSKVSRIVLAVNSPGGMVAGVEGAAAAISYARTIKRVSAMVEGMAASAAYWLASQADEIVLSPLSEVGSIGVVSMHVDASKMFSDAGLSVSLIHAGAHKVDGNPYEPLSASVRKDIQSDLDRLRLAFASAVARGRQGKFSAAAAIATEAKMFHAAEAVRLGMADRVGQIDDILSAAPGARPSLSVAAVYGRRGQMVWAGSTNKVIDTAAIYARRAGRPVTQDSLTRPKSLDAEAIYARRRAQTL